MEHEPTVKIGGIGRSSVTSYPEFMTFSPENYGHNIMGFHHHPENSTGGGLPHEIQQPVGVAVVPSSTTTGTETRIGLLAAADDVGIPHQETSSVVDMAGPKTGLQGPLHAGDASCCGLLVGNPQPQGHLHLQEVNAGLPQPGPYAAATGAAVAAAMEILDSGNALPREFNMPEVNAGFTSTTAGKEILQPVQSAEREAESLVVNAGSGLLGEPDTYSVDMDVYTATDKEIITMVQAKAEEYKKVWHPGRIYNTEAEHILAEKNPTELQEPVCYFRNRWLLGRKTHRGEWKEKHREVVLDDGATLTSSPSSFWRLLPRNIIGFKITFEFHIIDGTKTKRTDWLMHEYIPLHHSDGHLYLWHNLVLQKIFNKNDKRLSQSISNAEDGSWMDINGEATDELNRSKSAAAKRRKLVNDGANKAPSEPSKVWQHFIKIYDKRPDPGAGAKLLYGVCRYCHSVLKADNGTKSLNAHCNSCPCKHLQPSSS